MCLAAVGGYSYVLMKSYSKEVMLLNCHVESNLSARTGFFLYYQMTSVVLFCSACNKAVDLELRSMCTGLWRVLVHVKER